jgi:hypothetical protein
MAFVFLNRYLDLSEAIEDGDLGGLDNTDFVNTDIPLEIPLPSDQCVAALLLCPSSFRLRSERADQHTRWSVGQGSLCLCVSCQGGLVWNVIRRPLDKSLDSRRYLATAWYGTSSPQCTLVVLRRRYLDEAKREEVRTHVLAISMDQKAEQTLDLDERGTYVGSLIDARTRQKSAPCIVTGYVDPLLFVNSALFFTFFCKQRTFFSLFFLAL